jgi:hypothetical protein
MRKKTGEGLCGYLCSQSGFFVLNSLATIFFSLQKQLLLPVVAVAVGVRGSVGGFHTKGVQVVATAVGVRRSVGGFYTKGVQVVVTGIAVVSPSTTVTLSNYWCIAWAA